MTPAWAQRQEALLSDCIVSPDVFASNWLRVLGTAERSQIDQGVRHQLHAIVPLLDALEP